MDAYQIFSDAARLNMTGEGYVWIVTEQGPNSIHFRILAKIIRKNFAKMFMKKLSKVHTKKFNESVLGTCLIFKFCFLNIFVTVFVTFSSVLNCAPD